MGSTSAEATFWEHLDEMRIRLIKMLIVVIAFAVLAFLFKEQLFDVMLAPKSSDFLSYRLLGVAPFSLHLINISLTEQFMIHMRVAFYVGVLSASPYILYQVFSFVSPALYEHERRYALLIMGPAYVMFLIGMLLNYYLVFPLTVRFLGTYQVSTEVTNMLSIESYIDTLIGMSFMLGLFFELPVVCWLLGKLGIINAKLMITYRRHAIVAILVTAAIVTPTTDVFSLFLVALPIYLLYELSTFILKMH